MNNCGRNEVNLALSTKGSTTITSSYKIVFTTSNVNC